MAVRSASHQKNVVHGVRSQEIERAARETLSGEAFRVMKADAHFQLGTGARTGWDGGVSFFIEISMPLSLGGMDACEEGPWCPRVADAAAGLGRIGYRLGRQDAGTIVFMKETEGCILDSELDAACSVLSRAFGDRDR